MKYRSILLFAEKMGRRPRASRLAEPSIDSSAHRKFLDARHRAVRSPSECRGAQREV
jgi:hypothetical protein